MCPTPQKSVRLRAISRSAARCRARSDTHAHKPTNAAESARAAVKLPEQAARAGAPWRSEDPVPLCCDHGQPPHARTVAPSAPTVRVVGQRRNRRPHRAKHCVRGVRGRRNERVQGPWGVPGTLLVHGLVTHNGAQHVAQPRCRIPILIVRNPGCVLRADFWQSQYRALDRPWLCVERPVTYSRFLQ